MFVDVLVVFGKAFFCSPCAMYFAGVAVQVAVLLYRDFSRRFADHCCLALKNFYAIDGYFRGFY